MRPGMADSGRQRILFVAAEANIASFVAMYLQKAGFEVGVDGTGQEALAKAGSESPALIVLDFMLPYLDGIDVCRLVRMGSDLLILMLSARDDDVVMILRLAVVAYYYQTMPSNPRE